jgi:hypothetical protein
MSPAYALNAPPDARCDCGPALGICTHRALVPIDIREIRIADLDPAGKHPAVPAANPAADPTNTEGIPHV